MSEQITRKQVDWERANCKGIDPEVFYKQQSELLQEGLSFMTLRRICFACPIWRECLQIGVRYEQYGFWGGLSEEERRQVYANDPARRFAGLRRDLVFFPHINISEIIAIVNSVQRNYGDFGYKYRKEPNSN